MSKKDDTATVAGQLLGLVGKATAEDVAEIDRLIEERSKELDGLRAVRRVVALATGLEQPAKRGGPRKGSAKRAESAAEHPPGSPAATSVGEDRRYKAARYISKNGPTPSTALGRLFDIPTGSITATFSHPWFAHTDAGLDLTEAGRKAVR